MIDFIVHEGAGKGRGLKAKKAIARKLDELKEEYRFHVTEKKGDAADIARELSESGAEKIVAVGGDGTLHEVLNGLKNFDKVTFGVIPAGTGNDFAAAAGISEKPLEALDIILGGNARYVDFFDCSGVRGLNVIGAGIDVDILRHYASAKIVKGKLQYALSLIYCLIHYKPYSLTLVDENGERREKKAFIACACNGTRFGGGIKMCPVADPFDKRLNVIVVNDMPRRKILGTLIKLAGGKIHLSPYSECYTSDRLELTGDFPVEIDGEIYERLPFNVKIISDTLKMFCKK